MAKQKIARQRRHFPYCCCCTLHVHGRCHRLLPLTNAWSTPRACLPYLFSEAPRPPVERHAMPPNPLATPDPPGPHPMKSAVTMRPLELTSSRKNQLRPTGPQSACDLPAGLEG
eukprot:scaffold6386_cov114-Isochrysis_galbana.AAC.1